MSSKLNRWGLATLMLALVVAIGCADTAQEDTDATSAADDAAWAELEEQKEQLEAAREDLAEARDAAAAEDGADAAEVADAAEGDTAAEGDAEGVDPAADVARLENEVNEQATDFYEALVDYINSQGLVEGEAPTGRLAEALRMKSSEDMLLAREYIEKGGNYPRAITIYQDALRLDPENTELQEALADAQEKRYMSEERFAQAEEGMTQDEVRETLGQPNLSNIRTFPEDNVEAWFYAVDAHGSAAAVWFRESGGEMTAYKVNYEEVVRDGPTEVNGEDEDEPEA